MKTITNKILVSALIFVLLFTATSTGKSSIVQAAAKKELTQQQKVDKVLGYAASLKGTKFKYGGTTKKGFDSSGFIQYIFNNNGIKLPRTSKEIAKVGLQVKQKELKKGDLVFFDTIANNKKTINFVGIYIGKNQFIAATVKKGVSIQSLNNKYWSSKFIKANRVIKHETKNTDKNLIVLDTETINGFKKGKIKGLPFSVDQPLTMSKVEKIWGKPEKIFDHEDIHNYLYTKDGRQVVFTEDELKSIYIFKVEMGITRDEIFEKMGKPTEASKKILLYQLGDYKISFQQSQTNKWWIVFFIN